MRNILNRDHNFYGGDWSPDDRYLVASAISRSGGFSSLFRVPVDGGEPVEFRLPVRYTGLRLSPDGKSVSMIRNSEHRQIWAPDNFLPAAAPKK